MQIKSRAVRRSAVQLLARHAAARVNVIIHVFKYEIDTCSQMRNFHARCDHHMTSQINHMTIQIRSDRSGRALISESY